MRLAEMIAGLADAGVEFVIVGGVAAAVHGSARVTVDLDICYDPAPDNRERLAALLARLNACLRGVEPDLPFVMDAKSLETSHVLMLTTTLGDLDVMDAVEGVGQFAEVVKQSVEAEFAGCGIRVLSLPALLKAKRTARRARDLERIHELEALLELRKGRGSAR